MTEAELDDLAARALAEDLGDEDVTATATVPAEARARARIVQKAPGVLSGLDVAARVFRAAEPALVVTPRAPEGKWREGGEVMDVEGPARGILAGERTALNLLGRLSGVATLTARYVRAVAGTRAHILDTRKTTPGLRALEKAAVVAGGGVNPRSGLYDAILIKENHAAAAGGVGEAVRRARAARPDLPLEVECRTLEEVDEALAAGAPRILLDNMDAAGLGVAVERIGGRAEAEASGGISLETAAAVAASGVDFISVGALTHSAPALDLSLLLESL
ncbi:MAG TPA: carboxylating nicotinate-nucleotide diphosphorylase [Solirubrobacteraceae bacterium]